MEVIMAEANQSVDSEGRHERFKRLAEKRVVKAIKDIRLIANLSNRNNYDYEQSDIDKVFRTLEKEMKQAKGQFEKNGDSNGVRFSL